MLLALEAYWNAMSPSNCCMAMIPNRKNETVMAMAMTMTTVRVWESRTMMVARILSVWSAALLIVMIS